MKNILMGSLALPLLFGCSLATKKPDPDQTVSSAPVKVSHPITQDATMAHRSKERAGAAYNMEGYIHVLGQRQSVALDATKEESVPSTPGDVLNTIDQIDKKEKLRSYSLYEMARWKRFCDSGEGMDQKDWLFVVEAGGSRAIPANMDSCNIPAFTYKEYQKAWEKHCMGVPTSSSEIIILKKTRIATSVCKENAQS